LDRTLRCLTLVTVMFCRNANGRPATAHFPLNLATAFAGLSAKMVTLHHDGTIKMAALPINHSSTSRRALARLISICPSAGSFAASVLRASARYFNSLFLFTTLHSDSVCVNRALSACSPNKLAMRSCSTRVGQTIAFESTLLWDIRRAKTIRLAADVFFNLGIIIFHNFNSRVQVSTLGNVIAVYQVTDTGERERKMAR